MWVVLDRQVSAIQATYRTRLLTPRADHTLHWLDDAIVRIARGLIASVGAYNGEHVDEDLRPGVLLPGFVDAHLHFPQTRLVGSATGPLLEWLERSTFPEEARFASLAHARAVAAEFCDRIAAAGTTLCLAYGSVHEAATHALFEAMAARGLQGKLGPVLMDEACPPELRVPPAAALKALEGLHARWHGHDHGRLELVVVPRFALSCSRALLDRAAAFANHHGLWVSTHLAETREEVAEAKARFGAADYLQVYEDAGMVHARAVFAHCVHLSGNEWDRLRDAGCVVAHCPDSNDFLGSGGLPISEAQVRSVPVAVGTDVAAGRTFRVPRILSSAYDNGLRQGTPLSLPELLWWGTRGGALALGRADTGAIWPGLQADLCLFEPPPWAETADEVLGALVFDHDTPMMRRTWVRGRKVWPASTGDASGSP